MFWIIIGVLVAFINGLIVGYLVRELEEMK